MLSVTTVSTETTITFEGDHVRVVTKGRKNLEGSRRLWTDIAAACREHHCYKVLGISTADNPMSIVDGFAHAELFRELGFTGKYRIAWIETNEIAREKGTLFTETVLVNRGLPGRLFTSEKEAREYLDL